MKTIDVSKIDIFEVTNPKLQLILICLFTDGYVEPGRTAGIHTGKPRLVGRRD